MQAQLKNMTMFAVCALSMSGTVSTVPMAFVQVKEAEMPQYVDGLPFQQGCEEESAQAISIYHLLRKDFALSHKSMGDWLGVKRRSLYNWMNEPQSAKKYGKQIEYRLDALDKLSQDMEPEHRALLSKIAFSPIYGNPNFGDSILKGDSSEVLMDWYDKLFSQFESYRRTLKNKSRNV